MPRRQPLPDIALNSQSSISFVIPSIGTRDEFIDNLLIPSILDQGIGVFEIIIAGRYQGRYLQGNHLRHVPVRKFPVYFYLPLQKGISESRYDWVVALGDDMVLTDGWYPNLIATAEATGGADIYGFRLLNPDGSVFADIGDVFGINQTGYKIRSTSYFGSYVAKRAMFEVAPSPTLSSCDRYHGLLISKYGFKRKFLPNVCVIHYGALGREGSIPRASPEKYRNTEYLRWRLGMLTLTTKPDYKKKARKWFRYASKLEKKTKKIGIWGWFGHEDVDDELILNSMTEAFSHHEIWVYTDRPEGVADNHNIRHISHTKALRKDLNGLDLLLVGGGEVLRNKAITESFPKELMRRCETPIIVYAAGIPLLDSCSDLYYFLSRCYLITLRDNLCLNFIQQRFPDIPSQLLPDPAFMVHKLGCRKVPGKVLLTTRMFPEGRGQGLPSNVNEILNEELDSIYHYLAGKGYSPLVLGFESREEEMLSNRGYRYKTVNLKEAVEEVSTAELLIGAAYHSGVIAITQHTPAILVNCGKEMEGLKTLISTGISVANIEDLSLVREFDAFRDRKNSYKPSEIEALKEIITEFNDMYINYVY